MLRSAAIADKYDAKDYKVAVQGGEIVVRSVVPTSQVAGETFPLLVWYHAGGTYSYFGTFILKHRWQGTEMLSSLGAL